MILFRRFVMPRCWRWMIVVPLFCMSATTVLANGGDGVGVRAMVAMVPERGETVDVTLWYPARTGGDGERVGATGVFEGTPARRNAEIADGAFPVILFAHGGLRAAPQSGGWIAAHLAARGNIVVAVQPPRLGAKDAQIAAREVWLRPADLSAALSMVSGDPALVRSVAPGRVGAVGFFLGGTSVLSLVGGRLDADRYRRSCDGVGEGMDCSWFATHGVDLGRVGGALTMGAPPDHRVAVVVAVDPELSRIFTSVSLAGVTAPVTVINLGRAGSTPAALDAAGLETTVPGARFHRVADATQFSAFNVCTPQGVDVLRADGDDEAACLDGGERTRGDIQAEIAGVIDGALERGFTGLR